MEVKDRRRRKLISDNDTQGYTKAKRSRTSQEKVEVDDPRLIDAAQVKENGALVYTEDTDRRTLRNKDRRTLGDKDRRTLRDKDRRTLRDKEFSHSEDDEDNNSSYSSEMSWGYDKTNGPSTWAQNFPAAAGQRQSPVDIKSSSVEYNQNLAKTPLTINYHLEKDLQLENPGLSFKANISSESVLSGGPVGSIKFKLVQFHFHWGHDEASGSEHTVEGKMYPSELHLVHYNADKYASFNDAVAQSDGLAVLGVFIKVGGADHEGFKVLSDNTGKVKHKGTKCETGAQLNPASLLPKNTSDYWTYEGSLTTPPCCESVRWIVLKEPIEISKDQLQSMRNLCCDECGSEKIPANYRPPLSLGSRKLVSSFK